MRKSIAAIGLALAVWLVPVSIGYAAPNAHKQTRVNYTAAQCTKMFAIFTKATPSKAVSAQTIDAAKANTGHSCYATVTVDGPSNAINGASASWCLSYWTGWNFYTYLGIWIFDVVTNFGDCSNGSVNWWWWGGTGGADADCNANFAVPGYSYYYQWCGMWPSRSNVTQVGQNYNIYVVVSGFPEYGHGWMRDYLDRWGYVTSVYGCWQDVCGSGWT